MPRTARKERLVEFYEAIMELQSVEERAKTRMMMRKKKRGPGDRRWNRSNLFLKKIQEEKGESSNQRYNRRDISEPKRRSEFF